MKSYKNLRLELPDKTKIGFVSDAHNRTDLLDRVLEENPDVKEWFFLGDLFDFIKPQNNSNTAAWLLKNLNKFKYIIGNHDYHVASHQLLISFSDANTIKTNFNRDIELKVDNQEFFLTHSKKDDFTTFLEGMYTERDLDEDFPFEEDKDHILIGHNHKVFKFHFPYKKTEIWSIGSIAYGGHYAVYENGIVTFKVLI